MKLIFSLISFDNGFRLFKIRYAVGLFFLNYLNLSLWFSPFISLYKEESMNTFADLGGLAAQTYKNKKRQ